MKYMDRAGIYRKGRQGHARNVNSYKLAREKFKKWRLPFTAVLALLFVFGTAPIVGENFQASLLTNPETVNLVEKNPEGARKVLLSAFHDFLKDCERFLMTECIEEGKLLLHDIVNSGERLSLVFPSVEDFEERYEAAVALKACKFDLGKIALDAKANESALQNFLKKYGETLGSKELFYRSEWLKSSVIALNEFVDSCASR
jgi:hypothetical protein